ncbi:hypothetical protein ACFXHA_01285 [Nocardia sp. NPDC059240]|uniref:hypothetical protein n=1 Tax=Nocardia sp. NPDC059240 TaxID=3346786 RepID=UPI003690E554
MIDIGLRIPSSVRAGQSWPIDDRKNIETTEIHLLWGSYVVDKGAAETHFGP